MALHYIILPVSAYIVTRFAIHQKGLSQALLFAAFVALIIAILSSITDYADTSFSRPWDTFDVVIGVLIYTSFFPGGLLISASAASWTISSHLKKPAWIGVVGGFALALILYVPALLLNLTIVCLAGIDCL